jgi:hypothetical protein
VAITSYAELQSAVADWVERADLATRLPTFIANAEAKVNRWLRDRKMEVQDTASLDAPLTLLPADFAEAVTVQARLGPAEAYARLDPAPADVLAQYAAESAAPGRPRFYAVLGDSLMLYPPPDQVYQMLLTYIARLPALSDANPTNWLLAKAPDVYLDGALAGFYEFDHDWESANRHLQKFESGLGELKTAERRAAGKLRTEAALRAASDYDITRDL